MEHSFSFRGNPEAVMTVSKTFETLPELYEWPILQHADCIAKIATCLNEFTTLLNLLAGVTRLLKSGSLQT